MLVQSLVDMAAKSELRNLSVKDDADTVISYINLGLIELYKRFDLEIKEHVIALQESVEIYDMPADFMSIVAAYGEVAATSTDTVNILPVNVEDDPLSINTVNWYQVQIPLSTAGSYVSLVYSTSAPYLTVADLTGTLPIPVSLVEALLHYVGYRGHAALDGNVQAESNTHYQRFEASCTRAREYGVLTPDDVSMRTRITSRGFV